MQCHALIHSLYYTRSSSQAVMTWRRSPERARNWADINHSASYAITCISVSVRTPTLSNYFLVHKITWQTTKWNSTRKRWLNFKTLYWFVIVTSQYCALVASMSHLLIQNQQFSTRASESERQCQQWLLLYDGALSFIIVPLFHCSTKLGRSVRNVEHWQ